MSGHGYLSQMDRLLSGAASIFPDATHSVGLVGFDRPTIEPGPAGDGMLAVASDQANSEYARMIAEAEVSHAAIRDAAQSAADTARQAGASIAAIRDAAQAQGKAILPSEDDLESAEPHDLKLLVETMDSKLEAAQDVIGTTRDQFEQAATRMRVHV